MRLFVALVFLSLLAYEAVAIYSPIAVQAAFSRKDAAKAAHRQLELLDYPPPAPVAAPAGAALEASLASAGDAAPALTSVERGEATRDAAAVAPEPPVGGVSETAGGGSSDASAGGSSETGSGMGKPSIPVLALTRTSPKVNGTAPGANENFWDWFQATKHAADSGRTKIDCPEENKRLCEMFYKLVRKYKIRSVYDASCSKNVGWMPTVLRKISSEIWGFKYHCGETQEDLMASAKAALEGFNFATFTSEKWWRYGFPRDVELVFAWDVLAHTAYGRVWTFFVYCRKQEVKYVLVDNYPGILNDPSPERFYLNLRKHPFRFPSAKEVVQNVTETGETANRQLLFYEGVTLPDNLG